MSGDSLPGHYDGAGEGVPRMGVQTVAVKKQHRLGALIAPVQIVEAMAVDGFKPGDGLQLGDANGLCVSVRNPESKQ